MTNKVLESNSKKIVDEILQSKKYRNLNPSLVERLVSESIPKYKKEKEIVKHVKAGLHAVFTAFWHGDMDFANMYKRLLEAKDSGNGSVVSSVLKGVIERNSSSGERLVIVDQYIDLLKSIVDKSNPIIADIGCGIDPLLFIYKNVFKDATIYAYEIDTQLVDFLNKVGTLFGYNIKAECVDSVVMPPLSGMEIDVVLLLKMFTTLEFQQKGVARRLLDSINAKVIVVSYPTSNIGRNKKGKNMEGSYREHFLKIVEGSGWRIEGFPFVNELFFMIKK